ncbi:MAG: hypothetical protein IKL55_03740 [Clostridia bacterium]|nr:hypothetical protein [Clostridia bacterium]
MKKSLILILIIFIIAVVFFILNYKECEINQIDLKNFNLTYEKFNKENLNGLDITTVMNQATSNNEKYEIPKDENGLYILDDEYSIEIYVTMIINNETYRMERFTNGEMNSNFIRLFGEVGFKCTNINYHQKTGRIASMTFEATEY